MVADLLENAAHVDVEITYDTESGSDYLWVFGREPTGLTKLHGDGTWAGPAAMVRFTSEGISTWFGNPKIRRKKKFFGDEKF